MMCVFTGRNLLILHGSGLIFSLQKMSNVENTKKMHVLTRNLNQNKVEWILKDEYTLWHLESGGQ